MATQKVTEKILDDANKEAKEILDKYKKEAAQIRKEYEEKIGLRKQQIESVISDILIIQMIQLMKFKLTMLSSILTGLKFLKFFALGLRC